MNIRTMKTTLLMLFGIFVMLLSGCSSDYLREGYVRPSARVMTKIPEIKQQPTRSIVEPYEPEVKKYSITSSTATVVTPTDVSVEDPLTLYIDPYSSIPETGIITSSPAVLEKSTASQASPAVKSLMERARADLAIGNSQSAISKLERGLRIESQNPNIWHLLAKAQFDQSNHQQAISMAKKSIRYSDNSNDNDNLISQNWKLIQKAGEKSDDTIAIKEALDYFKVNP